jgi:hypothetical protein
MNAWRLTGAALLAALTTAAVGADEPKDKGKAKSDPPGAAVEAVLVAKKATYKLDLGGKSGDEFKKAIAAGDDTGDYPEAPAVDLVLELRNKSDKDVIVKVGGTMNVLDLDVQGPGATTVTLKKQITPKLIKAPQMVSIPAGKSENVPIAALSFGFKGAKRAYWTEPGKYTLAASYKTWVSPAPAGAKAGDDGFAEVTLTSAPETIVVEKDAK